MIHKSVLLHESIDALEIKDGDILVDATLGSGGHSKYALSLGKKITIVAIDLDPKAIERGKKNLEGHENIHFVLGSFRNIDSHLDKLGINEVQKIIFDFGLSSDQIEESKRGFSFRSDEPLLMTFGESHEGFTAREIVNEWDEENIRHIIRGYGEERFAGRIAKAIVKAREKKSLETTSDLAEIIVNAVPKFYERGRIHPATRTFQALRIAVNDELASIEEGLTKAFSRLSSRGRISAISFHSLEDRIVKFLFKGWKEAMLANVITKKPLVPQEDEIRSNPRARSAKLRVIEKI